MEITYRPIEQKDLEYRVKWLNDPRVNKYLSETKSVPTTFELQKKWFDDYEARPEKQFYTILMDDAPIGIVGLSAIDKISKCAHIFILLGDPQTWNKGIGTQAIQFIIKKAKELKLKKLLLEVDLNNKNAINLYTKNNFIETNKTVSELIMELQI